MRESNFRERAIHRCGCTPTDIDRWLCTFSLWFESWPFRILHKSIPRVISCYLFCTVWPNHLGVHVLLYYVHCIFVYGWSLEVVALWCYLKLCFHILKNKVFSALFNMQKFIIWASFFPHFWGFYFLFVFCNAASPKACWELSDHMSHVFWATFLLWIKRWVERGEGVCMALSLSVYCTFLSCDISIAKPTVFFWIFILTLIFLTYLI